MKKFVFNVLLSLLALLVVSLCDTEEDAGDGSMHITFDYSANSECVLNGQDFLISIYDAEGVCCDERSYTYDELSRANFKIELPGVYRDYRIVVRHELGDTYYQGSALASSENCEIDLK